MNFPGDGQASSTFSGQAKKTVHAGIAKTTTDNNTGNTVTLQTGEGRSFDVGALVMMVEADGTTRSADTPDGSPRRITAISGDVVTVDGAVLADADGSTADIFLCYYEPETPTAILEPATGLVGSLSIDTLPSISCMRSLALSIANGHEPQNYCYGKDELGDDVFIPGGRLSIGITMELNLKADLAKWMQRIREFETHALTVILGDSAGRHFKAVIPKAKFDNPAIPIPASGSVPISFSGRALQTAINALDAVTLSFN
jgi:hypothetical protein